MIRDIINHKKMKINVKLKEGTLFSNHDMTSSPFGEHEKIISFWIQNKIRIYPLEDVEYVEYVEYVIPQENENETLS